jgi:hypothetical protein
MLCDTLRVLPTSASCGQIWTMYVPPLNALLQIRQHFIVQKLQTVNIACISPPKPTDMSAHRRDIESSNLPFHWYASEIASLILILCILARRPMHLSDIIPLQNHPIIVNRNTSNKIQPFVSQSLRIVMEAISP